MPDDEVNKTDEGSIQWKKTDNKLYVSTKKNNTDTPGEPWIELTSKTKADVVKKLKKQIVGEEEGDSGEGENTWRDSHVLPSEEENVKNVGRNKPADKPTTKPKSFDLHEQLDGGKKSKKRRNKNKRHTRKNKN
jgi:hypothetical protein